MSDEQLKERRSGELRQLSEEEVTSQIARSGRACGDCSLCCFVLDVPEAGKPDGDTWCPHARPGRGCSIYADRPHVCRAFTCEWLRDTQLGPEWKPTVAKFVLSWDATDGLVLRVQRHPRYDRWREEPYISTLRAIAARGVGKYHVVVALRRNCEWVISPDGLVPPWVSRAGRALVESGNKRAAMALLDRKMEKFS
jgi:hypothetical protein